MKIADQTLSILLIDDHPIWREGLVQLLDYHVKFNRVAQASSGIMGYDLAHEILPDLILVDVNLPDKNGIQVTSMLRNSPLQSKIIMMTAYDDDRQAMHAMQAGCNAYLSKSIELSTLLSHIQNVFEGLYIVRGQVFSHDELLAWLNEQTGKLPYLIDSAGRSSILSQREMEILYRLTYGESNRFIAKELDISYQTVKNHVSSILSKLGVNDRFQAALYAIKKGWVRLSDLS